MNYGVTKIETLRHYYLDLCLLEKPLACTNNCLINAKIKHSAVVIKKNENEYETIMIDKVRTKVNS